VDVRVSSQPRAPRSALSAVNPSYPLLSAAFAATHGNQTRVADLLGRFEAIGHQVYVVTKYLIFFSI